ncbi:MAG: type II toxin-antitoxin system RatA family toxin [Thermomicrobiales bacterium]
MYTETSVVMNGPGKQIFALGAAIEDWPIILPHYRSVMLTERTEQSDGTIHKVATMKAWRLLPFGKIPVGWRTILDSNAETGLLHFLHIGGFTKGMDVHWLLMPEGDATRVTITHDFTLRWPLIGGFVAHRIVGQFFVDAIARRTLNRIKALVEGNLTPQPPLHCSGNGEGEHNGEKIIRGLPSTPAESPLSIADKQWRGAGDEGSHRD